METSPEIEFPEALQCLFQPKRFKVLWGGRSAGRSWGVARAFLLKGVQRPIRVLCVREFQNSIAESVHKVLSDQIVRLGLESQYDVEKAKIYGKNGTEFSFEGIKNNTTRIKSYEGIDYCWVEEAVKLTKTSWEILIPTIRREGSEIWMTFNPELATDYTYKRFVLNADDDCVVKKMTYKDNPWLTTVIKEQILRDKERDYDSYLNVWEGHCKVALEGAIYAREIRRAMEEGRICKVPYAQEVPVDTFWDLGRADTTAIWFSQRVGMQYRLLSYYEANGTSIPMDDLTGGVNHFLKECQDRGYIYGTMFLPHDAKAKRLGSKRSIEEIIRQAGHRVQIVPRLSVTDGINASRMIFPSCWFDEEDCEDGLNALRHYRYKVLDAKDDAEAKQLSNEPVHDWACLAPETKVLTRYGMCAISTIPNVGEVLTPCGWKQYHSVKVTRRNAPLVEVRFVDGLTVRCTREHMFLTVKGWKFAESLTSGMQIQSSLIQSRSISQDIYTGYIQVRDILRKVGDSCIVMPGKQLLEKFQKVVISITKMETLHTTCFPISNVYQKMNICPSLAIYTRETQQPLQRKLNFVQQIGIDRRKEDSGTVDMQLDQKVGKNGKEKNKPVQHVELYSWRLLETLDIRKFIALILARLKPIEIGEKAERIYNLICRRMNWDCKLKIDNVKPLKETSDVWCLTVPDAKCFSLANGAVVHNSDGADAFRYFAVGARLPRQAADGVLGRLARAADALRGKTSAEVGRGSSADSLGWMR